MPVRSTLLVVAALAATALAGCGSSNNAEVKSLKQTGTQLQQQGKALQDRAATIRQELQEGKITAEEANKELQQGADNITTTAKKAAGQAIDAAKSQGDLPDSAKKALDQAQQQLDAAGN